MNGRRVSRQVFVGLIDWIVLAVAMTVIIATALLAVDPFSLVSLPAPERVLV
ncbi:MAG: hypothetical protein AAF577_15840 [Pseudomonadota bacterium]